MNNDVQVRLLVVDDNPSIQEDFRKVLQFKNQISAEMQEDELFLFESSTKNQSALPSYIIDT
ncbi:MAG: hybrid sensor histidine kinase/response regulator, partial [Gammaproteobacteria bacterium]